MKKEGPTASQPATMEAATYAKENQRITTASDPGAESGENPLSLEALGYSIGKDCSKDPNQYLQASDTGQSGE
jgi:hypothetical protein